MSLVRQSYMKRPSMLHPVLPEIAEEPFRGWSFDGVRSHTQPEYQFSIDSQKRSQDPPSPPLRRGSLAPVNNHRSTASLDLARSVRAANSGPSSCIRPPTKSSFADSSSDEDDISTAVRRPLSLARRLLRPKRRQVALHGPTEVHCVSPTMRDSEEEDQDERADAFLGAAPSKAAKLLGLGAPESSVTPSETLKLSRSSSVSSAPSESSRVHGSRYPSSILQKASPSRLAGTSRLALNFPTAEVGVGLGIVLPSIPSVPTPTLSYNRNRRPMLVGVAAPHPSKISDPALVALQRAAAAATMTTSDYGHPSSWQPPAPSRRHTSPNTSSEGTLPSRPTIGRRSCSSGPLPAVGPAPSAPLPCPPSSLSRDSSSSSSCSSASSYSTLSSSSCCCPGEPSVATSTSTSASASPPSRPLSHISTSSSSRSSTSTDEGSREIAAVLRYLDGDFATSPTSPNSPTSLTSASPTQSSSQIPSQVQSRSCNVSVGLDVELGEDQQQRQRQRPRQKQRQKQRVELGQKQEQKTSKDTFHTATVPNSNFW
ncbi:hypothetical protein BCV69DRAFT_199241 [Microstroma glucosiphilum]|uniref:Uncharacterized protein n=1 Tax=Pseudomicrostroma glucosiphilum TaxID=1684307 RepID=A0A316UCL8_9BASI|nr:hypothetical protein BCV69DRAFT_199241 [Pseudomicrostroma glucosiphilum]PWN20775.1 hypothetical protein BCV69DRAFT_199241 [Pseudomicrostroma glucosiphilum]